jgi:hypothetical protein
MIHTATRIPHYSIVSAASLLSLILVHQIADTGEPKPKPPP